MPKRDITWWYWLVTDIFLAAGLFGWPAGLPLTMAICVVQAVHFLALEQRFSAFPVQVRVTYLGLLVAGQWPGLEWVNWVQLIGTSAVITVGYCPLARILSLLPWNRSQPLTWRLFFRTIFSPPLRGSIVQAMAAD